jgi:hypothetical protein
VKRSKLAAAASLCMVLGMLSPAFAAGDEPLDKVVDGSLIFTRVGGVGTALVVGPPVASVRESYKYYIDWTNTCADKVGGKDFGPSCALVSLVTLPTALVWGSVTGIYHGSKNAFMKGFTTPFHPDSFSLGKGYED